MFGPWKKIAESYGQMVLGYFGKTPVTPDPEIVELASEQLGLKPTTESPLVMNDADPNKGLEAARKMLQAESLPETDENLFIAATCREKGITFLKGDAKLGIRKIAPQATATNSTPATNDQPAQYTISVNDKDYFLAFEGNKVTVDGDVYQVTMKQKAAVGSGSAATPSRGETTDIIAEMPGVVLKILVKSGDRVQAKQSLLVMEAMKMEVPVAAPIGGTVAEVCINQSDQVASGQLLVKINA